MGKQLGLRMQVHMEANVQIYFCIKECLLDYYVPTLILGFMEHCSCDKTLTL